MDGTLIDSSEIKTLAFRKLYEVHGQDVADKVVSYHLEHQGVCRFDKFRFWQETLLGESYTESVGQALSQQFNELVVDAVVDAPYIPGAWEFLENYYELIPLFIASATPEAELKEIVSRRGMAKYFKGVFGAPATKGDILRRIVAENGLEARKVLMVGDAASDYLGAQLGGTAFAGISEDECLTGLGNVERRLPDLKRLELVVVGHN